MDSELSYADREEARTSIPIVQASDSPREAFGRMEEQRRSAVVYQAAGGWRFVSAAAVVEAVAQQVSSVGAIEQFEEIGPMDEEELREQLKVLEPEEQEQEEQEEQVQDEEDENGGGVGRPGPFRYVQRPQGPLSSFIARAEPAPARCYCTKDQIAVPGGRTGGNHGSHIGTVVCV